jgi:hypothetical protein
MLNMTTYVERIGVNIHTFTNNFAKAYFYSNVIWSDERECRIGNSYFRVMTSSEF